jgi:hypothetical protein
MTFDGGLGARIDCLGAAGAEDSDGINGVVKCGFPSIGLRGGPRSTRKAGDRATARIR